MKYKEIIIKEDKKIWKTGESVVELSKRTGIDYTLLMNLKNGVRLPSKKYYLKYRELILGK